MVVDVKGVGKRDEVLRSMLAVVVNASAGMAIMVSVL